MKLRKSAYSPSFFFSETVRSNRFISDDEVDENLALSAPHQQHLSPPFAARTSTARQCRLTCGGECASLVVAAVLTPLLVVAAGGACLWAFLGGLQQLKLR